MCTVYEAIHVVTCPKADPAREDAKIKSDEVSFDTGTLEGTYVNAVRHADGRYDTRL